MTSMTNFTSDHTHTQIHPTSQYWEDLPAPAIHLVQGALILTMLLCISPKSYVQLYLPWCTSPCLCDLGVCVILMMHSLACQGIMTCFQSWKFVIVWTRPFNLVIYTENKELTQICGSQFLWHICPYKDYFFPFSVKIKCFSLVL